MRDLAEYLYSLYDRGLMSEYATEHFLIQAMHGQLDFFDKHPFLYRGAESMGAEVSSTFLMNFSMRLQYLSSVFSQRDIERFVQDQLSAGKTNYNENAFVQAISEVNVLCFLTNFLPGLRQAIYEPPIGTNGKNPEARLLLDGDIIIDVEVKTPGFFSAQDIIPPEKIGIIKPNVILTDEGRTKVSRYCQDHNLQVIFPRVLKLKQFIESAGEKFEVPTSKKHYNILFINWTYTDFPECKLSEPMALLINPISGLCHNQKAIDLIGLDPDHLQKISAIILYQDSFDSLLFSDFRYHWRDDSCRLIINDYRNRLTDFESLIQLLGLQPRNVGTMTVFEPSDYVLKKEISDQVALEAANFIYEVLTGSDDFLIEYGLNAEILRSINNKLASVSHLIKRGSRRPINP